MSNNSGQNIHFKSDELVKYYSTHRRAWNELYPSERWIFERVLKDMGGRAGSVLDVGCAAGGLGFALSEKYPLDSYHGVDINKQVIDFANAFERKPTPKTKFECNDVLANKSPTSSYDLVTSLSAADFNVRFEDNLRSCWRYVKPGGQFVVSLRLTNDKTVSDMTTSCLPVLFGNATPEDIAKAEKTVYAVLNVQDILLLFASLDPAPVMTLGFGFWGKPNALAKTPFDRICFAVFGLKKSLSASDPARASELHLPLDAFCPDKKHR